MFSTQPRCIYRSNQLAEVICQLRFPEILTIETSLPAQFQEAIREEFPLYSLRREGPAAPNLSQQSQTNNYQFASADGHWRVNLTSKFIALACSRYTCWEDFAAKLDKPLAAFIQLYKPAFFERVGLRYLNFFSRKALGLEDTPYRELFTPCYLGLLADEQVVETAANRSSVDTELAIGGGCRVKIHAGPGLVKLGGKSDNEVKFIFDQDLYMPGNVPVNLSAPSLQTLHGQAYAIFRGAVTELLHNAMEPDEM